MTTLKPCPLCQCTELRLLKPNGSPVLGFDPSLRYAPQIICDTCGCMVPGVDWDDSGQSAIDKWNNRPQIIQTKETGYNLVHRAIYFACDPHDQYGDVPIVVWYDETDDTFSPCDPEFGWVCMKREAFLQERPELLLIPHHWQANLL